MDEESRSWRAVDPAGDGGAASWLPRLHRHPAAAVTVAAVTAVGIALGALWLAASASSPRVEFDALAAEAPERPAVDAGVLIVDVAGAVRMPGLYQFPAGARVGDAIAAAGGFGPAVDVVATSTSINLAAPLTDGQKIVVPARGADMPSAPLQGSPQLVDLNRASQSELEGLPGIGPVTANRIIAARSERPFSSARELLERKIVGQAVWEKIHDLVTAS